MVEVELQETTQSFKILRIHIIGLKRTEISTKSLPRWREQFASVALHDFRPLKATHVLLFGRSFFQDWALISSATPTERQSKRVSI